MMKKLFPILLVLLVANMNYNPTFANKTGLGDYGYHATKVHAVSGVDNTDGLISAEEQNITYTAFNKASKISEKVNNDAYELNIVYGPDQQRWKSELKKNGTVSKTTVYAGDYEKITENGVTRQLYYISGGDGPAAILVKQQGQSDKIYYLHRDHLGSILSLTDGNGSTVFKANYDAWGKQTITTNTFKFHRGFTGHEHLPEFSLINMNGRMYDPILGRFLSPDPYVQAPEFSQSFNRYAYCMNNPLIYTDPSGEIVWWIPAIVGALIGGTSNLVANWDNIDGFLDGLSTFGTGAIGGAVTAVTAGFGAGLMVTAGVAAGSGALIGANNDIVAQTGKNFSGFNNVDWWHVGTSAGIGAAAGFAGGAAGYWASNTTFMVNNISSPVLRSAVVSPIAAGAGHIAGGTTANLMTGQNFGEAFINSFDGIGKSMAIGGAIGVATTIGMSYANGVNPWTGKELQVTPKDLKIQSTLDRIKRGESFPHRNDGSVFRNREGFLPSLKNGDYIEYVHPTSGITGAGQQRIVISPDGHIYYTPNHYKIFLKIK